MLIWCCPRYCRYGWQRNRRIQCFIRPLRRVSTTTATTKRQHPTRTRSAPAHAPGAQRAQRTDNPSSHVQRRLVLPAIEGSLRPARTVHPGGARFPLLLFRPPFPPTPGRTRVLERLRQEPRIKLFELQFGCLSVDAVCGQLGKCDLYYPPRSGPERGT